MDNQTPGAFEIHSYNEPTDRAIQDFFESSNCYGEETLEAQLAREAYEQERQQLQ